MSARERIAAVVEWVRAGNGDYDKAARVFRMTSDVVRKACAAAGVLDNRPPLKLPPRVQNPAVVRASAKNGAYKLDGYMASVTAIKGVRVGKRGLG